MNDKSEQSRAWPARVVAVLNNGDTVIVVDDNCYALRNFDGDHWCWSAWIFQEALSALKALPDNPDDAITIVDNGA